MLHLPAHLGALWPQGTLVRIEPEDADRLLLTRPRDDGTERADDDLGHAEESRPDPAPEPAPDPGPAPGPEPRSVSAAHPAESAAPEADDDALFRPPPRAPGGESER